MIGIVASEGSRSPRGGAWRRLAAESLGTALLLSVIVGSGIAADTGAGAPFALLQHAVAVGAGLAAIIVVTQPVSGAHLNPLITVALWRARDVDGATAAATVAAQVAGAIVGVVVTGATFGRPALELATTARIGSGVLAGEAVATLGLVVVVIGLVRAGRAGAIPAAVGAWVTAIILSTSSTGFANPAVTVARAFTDSATGIAPASVPAFVAVQALALGLALGVLAVLFPPSGPDAAPGAGPGAGPDVAASQGALP